jgi:guanylate kinase
MAPETETFDGLPPSPPMVIVVSGPSGVGKTVICERLLALDPTLVRSISATVRPPRPDETDGVDYHFWSGERFQKGIAEGHFLEYAEVHGHLYGTPRAPIEEHLRQGRSPVMNVDVQGGHSVKRLMPESVLILVAPPSMEVLERRLRGRGTDSDDVIRQRLENARGELAEWRRYDYAVVNDRLGEAVEQVRDVIAAERCRVERLKGGS